ncbi:MAG TPA: AraC family transcriptional regulator [Cellulomonas sp.]
MTVPGHGTPAREVVVPDPGSMVRWHRHSYPSPLARWHTHPEAELHLIRAGTGLAFVGDHVGRFEAGQLVLVGPHLPHNWISDVAPGETVPDRDVLLQVHPDRVRALAEVAVEATEAVRLLDSARRGIRYSGATAAAGGDLLIAIGATDGLERLQTLLRLLTLLSRAPQQDQQHLSRDLAPAGADPIAQQRVDVTLAHIAAHLDQPVRLPAVAALVGMTPSAFSRFFARAVGRGFAEMVRRLRVLRACALLAETDLPVAEICYAVGYGNLSNFNRQFRTETGTTPRAYRRTARGA